MDAPAYYMLECYGPDEELRAGIDTVEGDEGVNWMLGARLARELQLPLRITLDDDGGLMMPMFNRGILVMSDELLQAFRDAGVTNLETFSALVFDPTSGDVFDNYKAVNVVGLVSCPDLGESSYSAHGSLTFDVDFDSLAIDPARAHGALMFRLAECVSGIVVHESVKRFVEAKGFPQLDWVEPKEWVG